MQYLLGRAITPPNVSNDLFLPGIDPRYAHHFPYFDWSAIKTMLFDPRVQFGLWLIKGPIFNCTRFFSEEEADNPNIQQSIVELDYHFPYAICCENKDIEAWVIDQYNRFWETGLHKALTAIEWGFSGCQVMYKLDDKNRLNYDNLILYKQEKCRVVTKQHGIIGFVPDPHSNNYIPLPKGFWHLHQREQNAYYGQSRLKGAHVPWHEEWMQGGARDIRRTWFYRNAYDGGELYYPDGAQDIDGQPVPNVEVAVSMLANKRTGGFAIFPSQRDQQGKQAWEYQPPQSAVTPQGMIEYLSELKSEILEGMGIPAEVVESKGSDGFGSATGRKVPFMAFIATLAPMVSNIIGDFHDQILRPILELQNKGVAPKISIKKIVPKTAPNQTELPGADEISQQDKSGL